MSDQPRRRGRPLKADSDRLKNNLTFRSTDAMYAQLRAAAAVNGRSINDEIGRRLAASFDAAEVPAFDPKHLTADGVRQIVREEIKAAQSSGHTVSFRVSRSKPMNDAIKRVYAPGDPIPVQTFGRDHLSS